MPTYYIAVLRYVGYGNVSPSSQLPPCRVTSCSPPHRLNVCTTFTVRQGLSGQTSWCWRSHRLWLRFYPPSCTISIYVCLCVCCAPCVCSVNRPVPSLLSCLGGFVSCHAHVTRPSSRAEPSQVTKWPSVQVAIHFLCFCFCFSFFALSLLRCLIKFQFQAGGRGPGGGQQRKRLL